MKITSVRIKMLNTTGTKLVGVVSLTFDDMIVIHDIKILQSSEEMFLAMPSKALNAGGFKDVAHPINAEVRKSLERIIFKAYDYCKNMEHLRARFDVSEDFTGSLLEENFEDLTLVIENRPAETSDEAE